MYYTPGSCVQVDFEKSNVKKMEKDLKKTLASLEEERAGAGKHKQVALMLIKERRKVVEKFMQEKERADEATRLLQVGGDWLVVLLSWVRSQRRSGSVLIKTSKSVKSKWLLSYGIVVTIIQEN